MLCRGHSSGRSGLPVLTAPGSERHRERLAVTRELFRTSQKWIRGNGRYSNARIGIVSKNKNALRNIVVRRVFTPMNEEIRRIILDKQHLRHDRDDTDYRTILRHLILWSAFESALAAGEISTYDGETLLSFPADEVEKQSASCEQLLRDRQLLWQSIIKLRESQQAIERKLSYAKTKHR